MAVTFSPHVNNLSMYSLNSSFPTNITLDLRILATPPELPEVLAWVVVTGVVCFLGCFNNIVMLLATWPGKKTGNKSGLNLLVFNFIAANLLSCLVNIPAKIIMVQAKQSGTVIGVGVCGYVNTVHVVGWVAVNAADATLAFNRCVALFFPYSYRAWSTNVVNLAIVAGLWLTSFAVIMPMGFGYGGTFLILQSGQCGFRPLKSAFGTFLPVVAYIPLLVGLLASLLIVWKIYSMSGGEAVVGRDRSKMARMTNRRLKMAKILLLTFMWGATFNTVYALLNYAFPFVFEKWAQLNLWLLTSFAVQYSSTPVSLVSSFISAKQTGRETSKRSSANRQTGRQTARLLSTCTDM